MPSGFVGTTVQNCLIIQFAMVCCAIMVSMKRGIPFVEAWREMLNLMYGDDQTPSFRDLGVNIPFDMYVRAFNTLGFEVTLADKTDVSNAQPEKLLGELEFLKRRFVEIDYKGKQYIVMCLSFESIYKMLAFREPSTSVSRDEWFLTVFDNAQFELAFHGQETYEKAGEFLNLYRIQHAPSLIIKPWEHWIDKFLSGVAPYSYA